MATTEEITLSDGTPVTLRPIAAGDKEELARAFDRLSPASRYMRFHSFKQALTDDDLRYLTEVDGADHFALVAVTPSHDMREEKGIGVARFVRDPTERDLAEAAITVADDHQGKGLGKLLLQRIVAAARARGVRRFQAEVLAENSPMVHLLRDAGAQVVRTDGASLVLEVPISAPPEAGADEAESPLFRVLRTIAGAVAELVARARSPWGQTWRPGGAEQIVIGVDLGGTKTEAIVARRRATGELPVLVKRRVPTNADAGYDAILKTVTTLIAAVAKEAGIDPKSAPIGIGMPGGITRRDGVVKNSNTVCLNGRSFRTDLQALLGRPIAADNDANLFALAESRLGAAAPHVDGVVFGVIMGTGVGGGLVVRGEVWPGSQGIAGEWGHTAVWPARDRLCYCGRRGCVELYASGPAVERTYAERAAAPLSLAEIVARRATDPAAAAAVADLLDTFGRGLANVIDVIDPSVVVLGGGVSNVDLLYTEGVARIASYVFNDELTTPILKNALGDSAGVLGAALIAAS
ncbi:MAG: ROK family protein [Polyangiaceae bacterium]